MNRILLTSATLLVSCRAWAGPPDAAAPAPATLTVAAIAPAAQRVYPPLPTLAMLPASIGDDDDPAPSRSVAASKKARKTRHVAVDPRPSVPEARLVVSDDSRVYLKDVDARLDTAFAR